MSASLIQRCSSSFVKKLFKSRDAMEFRGYLGIRDSWYQRLSGTVYLPDKKLATEMLLLYGKAGCRQVGLSSRGVLNERNSQTSLI